LYIIFQVAVTFATLYDFQRLGYAAVLF